MRLASCLWVPCHMCKKRLKNEWWPESVPCFPNQVAAASGKPLWDVKCLVHWWNLPGHSRKELGDGLAETGSGSWPTEKARLIFSSAVLHPVKAYSWCSQSSSIWMLTRAKVEFQHYALNYICLISYFNIMLNFVLPLQIFEILF